LSNLQERNFTFNSLPVLEFEPHDAVKALIALKQGRIQGAAVLICKEFRGDQPITPTDLRKNALNHSPCSGKRDTLAFFRRMAILPPPQPPTGTCHSPQDGLSSAESQK
jgi:hypothetical protein